MFQNRFDEFYMTICKETGGIEGLLKSFFDFMIRKTDFFYECDPGDKMGFPPGYSRKMLMGIFDRFQEEHYKRFPKKDPEDFERKLKEYQAQKQKPKKQLKVPQKKSEIKQSSAKQEDSKIEQEKADKKPETKQAKVQVAKEPIINTYNGGKTEKYSWSQQSNDVEVTIELEPETTAKMLNVVIKSNEISVKKKTGETVIEGQLYEKINAGDSVWKMDKSFGKTFLTFNLEKAQDKIWSTVFKGDPEIDTSKVNNTKKIEEFDGETQGAIRKIMYEQQRKQMGLPTTDEQKQIQALKKAWDADGSPFKGQPFDPSKINLSGSDFHPE